MLKYEERSPKTPEKTYANDTELTRFRRECVGFIFQFYNLIPSLTARENMALVTEITRHPMQPQEALERVGLGDRLDHFPANSLVENNSGWRSPVPLPNALKCCCAMNPPERWIIKLAKWC